MAVARFHVIRRLHRALEPLQLLPIFRSSWSCHPSLEAEGLGRRIVSCSRKNSDILRLNVYGSSFQLMQPFPGVGCRSIMTCSYKLSGTLSQYASEAVLLCSTNIEVDSGARLNGARSMSTMKVPAGAKQVSLKVTMLSPGFVYEPYAPREHISFWRRWFTPSGWKISKEDIILEMKSAYAITRLRKVTGYTKKQFYQQAVRLYKEINTLMASGDASSLRKAVTEKMYSTLKNELKRRQSMWSSVYWELVEPVVSIRTLRARMIALDKNDLDKAFVQLTLEFVSKQKFEAYDSKGAVVSGDKTKEVLVRDIWVFERSLFHPGADWRLCARISL